MFANPTATAVPFDYDPHRAHLLLQQLATSAPVVSQVGPDAGVGAMSLRSRPRVKRRACDDDDTPARKQLITEARVAARLDALSLEQQDEFDHGFEHDFDLEFADSEDDDDAEEVMESLAAVQQQQQQPSRIQIAAHCCVSTAQHEIPGEILPRRVAELIRQESRSCAMDRRQCKALVLWNPKKNAPPPLSPPLPPSLAPAVEDVSSCCTTSAAVSAGAKQPATASKAATAPPLSKAMSWAACLTSSHANDVIEEELTADDDVDMMD